MRSEGISGKSWTPADTFMIVYTVTISEGQLRSGLYMFDKDTPKTYPSYTAAKEDAVTLVTFLESVNIKASWRIVKVQ